MTNLKSCVEAKNGDIITAEGRMSYAFQSFKGQKNDNGDIRYTLAMLFPPDSDMKLLKQKMYAIALEKTGDKTKATAEVNKRFLDPVEKGNDTAFDGWTLLRMSSPSKPGYIFANGKEVPADDYDEEVYSGRWARVSVNPYWFDVGKNKGVTCGLQNIQLLQHDDPIGGAKPRASDQFEAVEGAADSPDDMFGDSASGSDEDPF